VPSGIPGVISHKQQQLKPSAIQDLETQDVDRILHLHNPQEPQLRTPLLPNQPHQQLERLLFVIQAQLTQDVHLTATTKELLEIHDANQKLLL